MAIDITLRKGRGFRQYGAPLQTVSGEFIEVYESSSASGPHCWLRVFGGRADDSAAVKGLGVAAHLNVDHAFLVHFALSTALCRVFLGPQETAYGEFVEIAESPPDGVGPCALRIFGGESTVHQFVAKDGVVVPLTREEAYAVQERLMAFCRDVPQRWQL
jgi:hypothetical protein